MISINCDQVLLDTEIRDISYFSENYKNKVAPLFFIAIALKFFT